MVRPRATGDRLAAEAFLADHHSARVARLGQLVHPLDHPAFVATNDAGVLLGLLTYALDPDRLPWARQRALLESR